MPLLRLVLLPLATLICAAAITSCGGGRLGEGGVSTAEPERREPSARMPGEFQAEVTKVVDGDTIRVKVDGRGEDERVRLLGIDAPEVSATRTGRPECGGEQARAALQRLADASPWIVLETDPSAPERDRYGRLLAYAVPGGGRRTSWQDQLLLQGWVKVYVLGGQDLSRADEFRVNARQARREGLGVWRQCGGDFRRPID